MPRDSVPPIEEVARRSLAQRLARLERTADDLAAAIGDRSDAVLSRRPDPKNWAPKEIVCHVRDTEELFMIRFATIMAADEPWFYGAGPARAQNVVARWAEDRQYLRNDTAEALATFRARRQESLDYIRKLTPEDLERGGIHSVSGRMTLDDFITQMAWHDDNHLAQLVRALEGRA